MANVTIQPTKEPRMNKPIKQLSTMAAISMDAAAAKEYQAHIDALTKRLDSLPEEVASQTLRELGHALTPLLNSLAQDIHSLSIDPDTQDIREVQRLRVNMNNLKRVLDKRRLNWLR